MKQKVFMVAGMHRSGTSLFASWLVQSGVFLGKKLYGSTSSNQKGHFEDEDFLELHKNDLAKKGLEISGLFGVENVLRLEHDSIVELKKLIDERSQEGLWGWKEPRTTLYINHYKELMPEMKVLAIFRHPDDVVRSLYTRLKKTKPYYTRNPLRKLYWFVTIDLMPRKWNARFSQITSLYHKMIVDYCDRYPDETMILELRDIVTHSEEAAKRVSEFLGLEKPLIPFHEVFSANLLGEQSETRTEDALYIALQKRKVTF